jgi:hypothetical protein
LYSFYDSTNFDDLNDSCIESNDFDDEIDYSGLRIFSSDIDAYYNLKIEKGQIKI